MKKHTIFLAILASVLSAFSQVTIAVPYENGQIVVKANITYPATITAVDSVQLEACYQEYSEVGNPKVFKVVKVAKGMAKSITQDNSFRSRPGSQTFRCVVYPKGKKGIVSNEVNIDYNGYLYREGPLAKVSNLKGVAFEKDGKKYVTLTWDAVPEAFGYLVYEKSKYEDKYYGFQLPSSEMSETVQTTFTFETQEQGEMQYGVEAVNAPFRTTDATPFNDVAGVKVLIP